MRVDNLYLVPLHLPDQAPDSSPVKPSAAIQTVAHHVVTHKISEGSLLPGSTEMHLISITRQEVDDIDSHSFGAAGVQRIYQMHYTNALHTLASAGRIFGFWLGFANGIPQCDESKSLSASPRLSKEY